jgi:hypothetical protein
LQKSLPCSCGFGQSEGAQSVSEIPEEIVTSTWQAVAAISEERAHREIEKVGREQSELLAFVLGSVSDCRPQAQELAVYLYFVIYQIFKNATKGRFLPINEEQIEAGISRNEERLARLEGAHPRFQERVALLEMSPQPCVVKYLVDAIMEAPEIEDPVELSEEESGILFLVLKTVIDLLHGEMERVEAG